MRSNKKRLNSLKFGLLGLMFILSNAFAESAYLEPVTLPQCNANDPEVQLISSNADWSKINDASKRIFCVKPGDYRGAGVVTLTADGTSSNRRYIILNNGNDMHPGTLSESEQANVRLVFSGANYWTIDRISNLHSTDLQGVLLKGTSQYNILNRMHISDFYKFGVLIMGESHNNTIQKSRIADQSLAGRKADGVGITFIGEVWNEKCHVHNTKIVANEIKNTSDGIQLLRLWKDWNANIPVPTSFDGTVIDSNHIYITPDIYTDGKGNHTTSGKYAYAENAIDLKAGSDDINNKIIITNNYMWGYRTSDSTGSSLSGWGDPAVFHYGVKNMIFSNNYLFDSNRGFGAGDAKGSSYGLSDSTISNNIIWDMNEFDFVLWACNNLKIENNIIEGARNWASFNGFTNSTLSDNVIINAGNNIGSLGAGIIMSNTRNYTSADVADSQNDLTFMTDIYTKAPRTVTLFGAAPTTSSPYYDIINFIAPVTVPPATVPPAAEPPAAEPPVVEPPVAEEVTGPFIMDVYTKELK